MAMHQVFHFNSWKDLSMEWSELYPKKYYSMPPSIINWREERLIRSVAAEISRDPKMIMGEPLYRTRRKTFLILKCETKVYETKVLNKLFYHNCPLTNP